MSGKARRRSLTALYEVHGGRCFYCDRRCRKRKGGHAEQCNDATRDHWMPKSLGGSCDPSNLRLACRACNYLKGNLAPVVFVAMKWIYRAG